MVESFLNLFEQLGYGGIVLLMALESSFFPFPSEVVMIPAGVLAAQGRMNPWLAILAGILGSWLGALVNYYIAVWFGRPFLNKYGKYVLMPAHRLDKVEYFFVEHGEISTFTGRLIPAVRQYISFPAGLSRMNLPRFLLFTGLGAGLWVTILVWIGYAAGSQLDKITSESVAELWHQYSIEITLGLVLFCVILIGLYILWYRRKKSRRTGSA
jgi:membrane protein DedA with SNARE-associated domain